MPTIQVIEMQKKKDVLTTGQVAEICNVAPRTVTKWFDSGQLKGYRIPGSRDRRIPTSELVRFMKAHDIPTEALEAGRMRILIIDSSYDTNENFAEALRNKSNYEIETAQNSFDAGVIAQKLIPHVIMVNLMAHDINATELCKYVRVEEDLNGTKVIAIAEGLGGSEIDALLKKGFDAVLTDSSNLGQAMRLIEETTAIIY